jgi:transposase
MENLAQHPAPLASVLSKAWFDRHPRFVPHFIPTSSSWLNMIERWFALLSTKAIRRRMRAVTS